MAYNGYGGGNAYNGSNAYNPYETRETSFDNRGARGPQSYSPLQDQAHNVEMQPLNTYQAPYGQQGGLEQQQHQQQYDPNATLNDCRAVSRAIDQLEEQLGGLQQRQRRFISSSGADVSDINNASAQIMAAYRELTNRVRRIKGRPDASEPRNRAQVEALDRRIRKAINAYQQVEAGFRREVQEDKRRQYQIVNPAATEEELREVAESSSDVQIFQQALMQSNRRGEAQSTLNNVRQRHQAIQKIEQDIMELSTLMQDLDRTIVEQEPMLENIETKAMETNDNLEQGVIHVGKAVDSARAARKKKWICLGISVVIILVIIIIVVVYLAVTGRLSSSKKSS